MRKTLTGSSAVSLYLAGLALLFGILVFLPAGSAHATSARYLSFEDRVRAQEAIERVYYSHQIGATEPFEEVVPWQVLEEKVRRYLRQSVALEQFWKTPITGEMLRREVERMAKGTRLPGRLAEIYTALGHDPFLIEECLARAALADRLSRNFFAYDPVIHAETQRQAEALHHELETGAIDLQTVRTGQQIMGATVAEIILAETLDADRGQLQTETILEYAGVRRLELSPEEFRRQRGRLPKRIGTVSPVEEGRETFAIRVMLSEEVDEVQAVSFTIAKITWDEWWDKVAVELDGDSVEPVSAGGGSPPPPRALAETRWDAQSGGPLQGAGPAPADSCSGDLWDDGMSGDVPSARTDHTVVWTGSIMIVWGGQDEVDDTVPTGGRYNPATDTWRPTSTSGAPSKRHDHTAVWTGSQMVVWGGYFSVSRLNTGGRYDPSADTWAPTSTTDAPSARRHHSAVWTGSLMIVWGGDDGSPADTGGLYDPSTDTWTPTSTTGAPPGMSDHTAVWTGNLVIIWGGDTGGRYNPADNTWASISTAGAPSERSDHTAVWTGSRMVIWGGRLGTFLRNTGGLYDPVTDTWTPTSTTETPAARHSHTAVWTGSLMVVWGGDDDTELLNTGGRYDPATDAWSATSTPAAPRARYLHTAVWAENRMIVWGGFGDSRLNTGGRYDPVTDTWTPTSINTAPSARHTHTTVWTGSLMLVWGGYDLSSLNTGGRYDPATNSWSSTSTTNAPSGRYRHTSVWTGSRMVVWGGLEGGLFLNTGGRYDPITNAWTPTSTTDAPPARAWHTAAWTGSRMIVWGGAESPGVYPITGSRYDPVMDTWTPTSTTDAPSGRTYHSSVWTGSQVVVWGGYLGSSVYTNSGGRYDPIADTWAPTSLTDAPSARSILAAAWTGSLVVVWGGSASGPSYFDTGGRYNPSTDTWTPTSTTDAPSGRSGHTAVWTGNLLVVWGGYNGSTYLNIGGRYDPATDTWTPTSATGTPSGRSVHTAVWTGGLMVVWGGYGGSYFNDGGLYIPDVSVDYDGDGYAACQGDCNDSQVAVYPGAPEVCDGIDNQCPGEIGHGQVDEGFLDTDVDSVADCVDNCRDIPNAYQFDADSDGAGDACDCAPSDASAFSLPHDIRKLQFTDLSTIEWDSEAPFAGTGTVYDLLRGKASELPVGEGASEECIENNLSRHYYVEDYAPPLPDEIRFYLIRGENACGTGTYGSGENGERTSTACP